MLKYTYSLMNRQHAATLTENNKEEAFEIKCIVTNNYTPSFDYRIKQISHPFVQCYDEREGWILIEFWAGTKLDAELYIEYVNDQIAYKSFIEANNYDETKSVISDTERAIYYDRLKVFTDKQEIWIKYIEEYEKEGVKREHSVR